MKVLVWLLISLLWSLICSKFINKQYVCRWIRLKTKALEIRNALIKAHLLEIWKGQNIIKTTKYLSQEENLSLIKILPEEHCKPISLCTNSHREIPAIPAMRTGVPCNENSALWEFRISIWPCSDPVRDCSEATAAEEFHKNSKAIWLFLLGFFNSSIRILEEFSDLVPIHN